MGESAGTKTQSSLSGPVSKVYRSTANKNGSHLGGGIIGEEPHSWSLAIEYTDLEG